jgi:WD40 repeat protein
MYTGKSGARWIVFLICGYVTLTLTLSISAQDQSVETPAIINVAKWSPQGDQLLVAGRSGTGVWGLWLYDVNLQPIQMFPFESPISADWSPDGTRFAMGRTIVTADTLQILATLDANSGIGGWSPDSSEVMALADESSVGFYNAVDGSLNRSIPIGDMVPDGVIWSPDSQYLLFVQPTGMIDVIDSTSGDRITTFSMDYQYPLGLRWSPDSRYLAAGFIRLVPPGTPNTIPTTSRPILASVLVWDSMTGEKIHQFDGLLSAPTILRWHPQKPELAAGTGLGLIYRWDIESGQLTDTLTTIGGLSTIEYSPFGGRLVIGAFNTDPMLGDSLNSQRQALVPQIPYWEQSIVPNVLEVLVPDPSVELLNEVGAVCMPSATASPLTIVEGGSAMTDYVEALEANTQIPPGCRADLLAVAAALQAQ